MCLDESPTQWSRATCCGASYCAVHDEDGDEFVGHGLWSRLYGCPACRAKPEFELFVYAHYKFSLELKTREGVDNTFNKLRIDLDDRSGRRVAASFRRGDRRDFDETVVKIVTDFLFARRHTNALAEEFVGRNSNSVPTVRAVTDASENGVFDLVSDEADEADETYQANTKRVVVYSGAFLDHPEMTAYVWRLVTS